MNHVTTPRHDGGSLAETEIYVRRHFRNLSLPEHALYFDALRILEQKNGGLFKRIDKTEDVWARESGASRPTVRKGLGSLQQRGLIHRTPGSNGIGGGKRKKSVVRRCTVEEIAKGVDAEILNRFIPADIEALAADLQRRGTPWDGNTIYPKWSVTITGRLTHKSSPMTAPRTNTTPYRLKAFRRSLAPDEILIEADWAAAEPTVLCHALSSRGLLPAGTVPQAIYEAIQGASGVCRDDAKRAFQRLVYSARRVLTVPEEWQLPATHFLCDLLEAVSRYREYLWQSGKPCQGDPRFVNTLTGRKMIHDRKGRTDRGDMLAWQLQGTVADIHAKVLKQVLQDDAQGLCRFFFPCHDAVYVAVKHGSDYDPAAVMRRFADEVNIPLHAKTERHTHP